MKSIRIATDVKHIEESDERVTLLRIQEILSEHRSSLAMRILGDLSTYLQFKFYIKVEGQTQGIIREKLFDLANSRVNLDRYVSIVHEIEKHSSYRVPCQDFFREIDEVIDSVLNPSQLMLVK